MGLMSGKGPGEMAVITVNAQVDTEILETFLIPSIERFDDAELIFQDDNACCHSKKSKLFFRKDIST